MDAFETRRRLLFNGPSEILVRTSIQKHGGNYCMQSWLGPYLTALELGAVDVHDLKAPALPSSKLLVHAKDLQGEEGSLVPASTWCKSPRLFLSWLATYGVFRLLQCRSSTGCSSLVRFSRLTRLCQRLSSTPKDNDQN